MSKWIRAVGAILGTVTMLAGLVPVVQGQDPTKVGPDVYKSLFENERVRANMITFKPGATIVMHAHPDHVLYWITGGTLRITNQSEKPAEITGKEGDVMFLPAVTHAAENIGKTEIRIFQVELKEPTPLKQATEKK